MERYLAVFHRIRQDASDVSEYENFATAAIQYLNRHPDGHAVFLGPLGRALSRFRRPYMVSLAYRILSRLRCDTQPTGPGSPPPPVSERAIKEHYRNRAVRGSILEYVVRSGLRFLDSKIMKTLVLHPRYTSEEVFGIISKDPECVRDFMFAKAPSHLIKQLRIIENCLLDYNLEYYLQVLGSSSKIRALRAHVAFTALFIGRAKKTDGGFTATQDGCILFSKRLLYCPQHTLRIESLPNFLAFGFNFISDRDRLVDLCAERSKNAGEIGEILAAYSDHACPLGADARETQLVYSRVPRPSECLFAEETNFDHLFGGNNFKDNICDCLEI